MLVGIVALYIADVIVNNFYASAVFKIRALFRLFKITLHVQNIIDPHYKFKKKVKQIVHKSKGEEVAEILEGIKQKAWRGSRINVDENQIDFCIKTLKSGKMYKVQGK